MLTTESIPDFISSCNFSVVDEMSIPGKEPNYDEIPHNLHPMLRNIINAHYPKGLYSHQSKSINSFISGNDICLSTSTASGKSLIFIASAIDAVLKNVNNKVLALYPAKALIQDQIGKWNSMLNECGLKSSFIDGSVSTKERPKLLNCNVVLMTPDVAHAWLMSNLNLPEVKKFIENLYLLILDESHVYDGVFGTNMAFLLRRMFAVSKLKRVITSTATIGDPGIFVKRLTGRQPQVFERTDEGSPAAEKKVYLVKHDGGNILDDIGSLVLRMSRNERGKFIAFCDSRKLVEHLVSVTMRGTYKSEEEPYDKTIQEYEQVKILPYRAGYEEEDRIRIQQALTNGDLAGVVSTSAMELGLDVGDIDAVLIVGTPPSVKSFWQRLGRAGRINSGLCILIDDNDRITSLPEKLKDYIQLTVEPNWLYLDNVYIQYSHALCASYEVNSLGEDKYNASALDTLPHEFVELFNNEIRPTKSIPTELSSLKQRSQLGPHLEFPLRNSIEKNFEVSENLLNTHKLGNLSYSQVLREAYPGAIYYYFAKPYRVVGINLRSGEIHVKREKKYWTTKPDAQCMVFPKFNEGILNVLKSERGFVCESNVQVSERVCGFIEQKGPNKTNFIYDSESPYYKRPITRFFETTGVCIFFTQKHIVSDNVSEYIFRAFSSVCGIQSRDLGIGTFHSQPSELWPDKCQGICIYDAVYGSLRLTKLFIEYMQNILDFSVALANSGEDAAALDKLIQLNKLMQELQKMVVKREDGTINPVDSEWYDVICPGQTAVHCYASGSDEVVVVAYKYTPKGLMYQLKYPNEEASWFVPVEDVKPMYGVTKMIKANLITGEEKEIK